MTPKEKAKELIEKFVKKVTFDEDKNNTFLTEFEAKQCALIAVDEIIEDRQSTVVGKTIHPKTVYWQEVKQEIEKL